MPRRRQRDTWPQIIIKEVLNNRGLIFTCHFCGKTFEDTIIFFRIKGKIACSFKCLQNHAFRLLLQQL